MGPIDPRLLRSVPAARRSVAVSTGAGLISTVAAIVVAVAVARGLAAVVTDPASRSLHAQAGPLIIAGCAFLVRAATAVLHDRFAHRASTAAIARLRLAGLDAVTDPDRMSPRELHRRRADLTTTLTRGLDALEPYLTAFVPSLMWSVTVTPAVVVVLAVIDPLSAVLIVVTLPLIPVFMVLIGVTTRQRTRARLAAMTEQGTQTLDLVAGVPTLRALHRARQPGRRIATLGSESRATTMAALRVAFLSGAVLELLATLCVAVVAVSVGLRLVYGDMLLVDGVAALILAPEVYLPLRAVGAQFHASEAGRLAAAQVLELTDLPKRPRGDGPVTPDGYDVVFDDVGIRDRDGWSPVGLNAVCRHGTVTVLTGPNGAGKTTALQAVAGLLTPDAGAVRIGGVAATDAAGRTRVAFLAQPPVMVAGTVRENLALFDDADRPRDFSRCAAAAEVGVDRVVAELPDGVDTRLGPDGAGLSTGQRQRLAFTRALTSDAPILLLDEPTAHLDADSEARVVAAIRQRAERGATVIVAGHRPALLSAADAVVHVRHSGGDGPVRTSLGDPRTSEAARV